MCLVKLLILFIVLYIGISFLLNQDVNISRQTPPLETEAGTDNQEDVEADVTNPTETLKFFITPDFNSDSVLVYGQENPKASKQLMYGKMDTDYPVKKWKFNAGGVDQEPASVLGFIYGEQDEMITLAYKINKDIYNKLVTDKPRIGKNGKPVLNKYKKPIIDTIVVKCFEKKIIPITIKNILSDKDKSQYDNVFKLIPESNIPLDINSRKFKIVIPADDDNPEFAFYRAYNKLTKKYETAVLSASPEEILANNNNKKSKYEYTQMFMILTDL